MPLLRKTSDSFTIDVTGVCFMPVLQSTYKHRETSDTVVSGNSVMGEHFAQGLDALIKLVFLAELNSSVEVGRKRAIYLIHSGCLECI